MIPHGERREAICFLSGTHRDQGELPLFGPRSGNKAVTILLSETKLAYLDEVICISFCHCFTPLTAVAHRTVSYLKKNIPHMS